MGRIGRQPVTYNPQVKERNEMDETQRDDVIDLMRQVAAQKVEIDRLREEMWDRTMRAKLSGYEDGKREVIEQSNRSINVTKEEKEIMFKILRFLRIVDTCPNCDSAWTGGCPDPEKQTHCIVCGDANGLITGWVWGRLVDPFCWLGERNVDRNLKRDELSRKPKQ